MSQQNGTFQSTWIDVNGLQVHTVVSTDPVLPGAPTVGLVHGLGLSHRYMVPIAARLAPVYRVYIPDLPGFGDRGKPSRVLDVPGLADALAAWMRTVGLGRAALFGNSFGCQIIVDLAARYPEQVERAVLQGPTTDPTERSWFWQFVRWRQNSPYNPRTLGPITRRDYRGISRAVRLPASSTGSHRSRTVSVLRRNGALSQRLERIHSVLRASRGGS